MAGILLALRIAFGSGVLLIFLISPKWFVALHHTRIALDAVQKEERRALTQGGNHLILE